MKLIFRYKLVVDAHNEAIQPYLYDNVFIRAVGKMLIRYSDLTIVTNQPLADIVVKHKGSPCVLPDPIPKLPSEIPKIELSDQFNILLIATYADDEPVEEIFEAVGNYNGRISLYVTGDNNKLKQSTKEKAPSNVLFTGFLRNLEYWGYLKSCDAIIDLTAMKNCLVCGAYEGVAVEKPMILTDDFATRTHFRQGIVYSGLDSQSIESAISELLKQHEILQKSICELKAILTDEWEQKTKKMKLLL